MTPVWTPVTDRVFVTRVEPHGVNVGLVVGADSALLVDSGNTPEQGRELIESAAELAGVPVSHVVVTHDHDDHSGGVAGMGQVTSIAHENLEAFAPTRQFSMAVAVDLGGQRVEMIHFGEAHTRSDVLVFVPGESVIFAGDLLEEGGDPQVDDTTSLSNWPTVLDGALGASTGATRFVPGHGKVVDRDFAFVQRAEIAMIYSQTEMLIQQGVKVGDAAAATQWPFSAEMLAVALPKAYAELAAKGVEPRTQLPILNI
ncbi:Glyoxylase, beta-lactamase superfamily II [Tessaracoccus bendigoensis DSM 12906]|uniref:Glyoxylase, beta-lactamase superfamily II n=1 Tax=Tessaracoccus bendigoensis DSM 12906 TaxID=1123357 RepID=A0A1M6CZ25_9ACTN|nr:MBL fold metallo-hydrolase [Tessaracoccus bendigoensis]SHI66325.1 Glyoxylase, beta-lactamase superfamily II [Tessaracoccus bendigoensis DSM 12906]